MKKLFFAFMAVALLAGVQSCKKCGICSYNGSTSGSIEYCEKDSKTWYDAAKLACESSNGTWTTK